MRLGRFFKQLIEPDSEEVSKVATSDESDQAIDDSDDDVDAVPQNIENDEIVESLGDSYGSSEAQPSQTSDEREPSVSEEADEELPVTQSDSSNTVFATETELEETGINIADLVGDNAEDSPESNYPLESKIEPVDQPEPVDAEIAPPIESSVEEPQEPEDHESEIDTSPELESIEEPEPEHDEHVEPIESAEIADENEFESNEEVPELEPSADEQDERSLARSAVSAGFVITLATELRTPISSLRVSFDLLKDPEAIRNNPDETKRLVGNIERSIARLERQASDLLEVGYINTGSLSLIKQPINMSEPILAAMDISRSSAALRQVAIELDIEPNLPRPIADGFRLTQIMTHLLSNSIKFTPVGKSTTVSITSGNVDSLGPSGEIRSGYGDTEPDSIIVRVIDNGPGIRKAHFERVFEPFYRITDEGTEGGAGVGLGLAIVKGLVELHSGKVWVKSTPREVTEFGFAIPLI